MRTDSGPGCDDSGQVKGIGSRDSEDLSRGAASSQGPQGFQCLRQCKLFAQKSRHESAPPYLSSGFKFSIHSQQVAPWNIQGFASQQISEHNAPTLEQLTSLRLEFQPLATDLFAWEPQKTPAPQLSKPHPAADRASSSSFPLGINQRPQVVEPIGRDKTCRNQFPQPFLGLCCNFGRQRLVS